MNTHQGHSSSLADSTLTLCETRQELIDQHLSSALEDLSTFLGQFSPPIQQSEMVNSQDSFIQLAFEPDDADVSGLEESLLPSLLPPAPRVEPLKLHRLPPAQVSRTKANRSDGRTDPTYALGRLLDMELSAALIESHPTLRALLPSVSRQPSLKVRSSFINMDAEDEQGGDESLDDMLLQDDRRFSNALNISLGLSRDSQALGLFSMDQLEDAIKTSRRQSWVGSLSQDLNSYLDLLDDEVELETQIDQPGNGVALVVLSMQKASVEGSTARIDFCSPNLETNIKKLLSAWRNNKHGPIIHAHQISGPTFHPSKSSSRGVAYCTPWSDELTVHKKGSSAFWGTDLEFLLKQTGCSAVCLVGLHTSTDVFYTTQHARSLGVEVIIPADAVADSGQADSSCFKEGHSEVDWSYSSRQAHEVAINTLTEGGLDGPVAEICSTQEILQALEQV